MGFRVGIVGLPNVGKSTIFNTLSAAKAEAANYPFCTIDPNVGVVKVPDERLEKIAQVSRPRKILPTTIEFVDIAGLVKGASQGEGLGNKFLAHIRECDAVCQVVREFKDDNIIHIDGSIDPERDQETIKIELIMADLESVTRQLDKAAKEARTGDKEKIKRKELLEKIKIQLDSGRPVREMDFTDDESRELKSFNFLTAKPIIYVINIQVKPETVEVPRDIDGEVLALNIKLEDEIAQLPEAEQKEYVEELGLEESGLNKLIKASYKLLGLITFLTTGPDETRAWTVKDGAKAPEAAGRIHTDFQKGFIRAEVINWEKFIEAGGEAAAREKGWIRTEGKDYIIQDGDICNFLVSK